MVSIGEEVMVRRVKERAEAERVKEHLSCVFRDLSYLVWAGRPDQRGGWDGDRGYGYGIGMPQTNGFKHIKERVFKSTWVRGENFKTYWGPAITSRGDVRAVGIRASPEREGQSKNYHQVIKDIQEQLEVDGEPPIRDPEEPWDGNPYDSDYDSDASSDSDDY
jgi:hypothetical protein